MKEISRKVFVTLNKENNMYYVLNDNNFIFKYYAPTEERAKVIFNAWLSGGYRERYAIENGVDVGGCDYPDCIQFVIPQEPNSDSNGALYHIKRKEWVN